MPHERSFGRWLQQRRKALDLTQEALGALVGCAAETIRRYEAERLRPSHEVAVRLATALQIEPHAYDTFVQAARDVNRAHRAVRDDMSNLALPLTSFIGRSADIAAVRNLLERDDVRIVTLVGAPGIGKTRLSVEVIGEVSAHFADGIVFVALASVSYPGLVLPTIAQALGVKEIAGESLATSLHTALRDKHLLLVLDNFEQVVDAAPDVADLFVYAPDVKVLVSSRTPLHVPGEHVFVVPALSLPPEQKHSDVRDVLAFEAVQLFVTRAQAVQHDFALTFETAQAVAGICWRLDGLPLAVELAAARVRLLPPVALLARLNDVSLGPLHLLKGGPRTLPTRHQTLRAMIAWSYDLLEPSQQQFFRRLGIFVGGWTVEAACEVCNATVEHPSAVVDGLQTLLDHSLIQGPSSTDIARCTMLETIRDYARDQAAADGELPELQQRHAHFFLAEAEHLAPQLRGPDLLLHLRQLDADLGNVRAAMEWAYGIGNTAVLLRFVAALWSFWFLRGLFEEWELWSTRALEQSADVEHEALNAEVCRTRAQVLLGRAFRAHYEEDRRRGATFAAQGLALSRSVGDTWTSAACLAILGAQIARWEPGELQHGVATLAEGLVLARNTHDPWLVAWLLTLIGHVVLYEQGDHALAEASYREALALARQQGDPWLLGRALTGLGDVARMNRDYRHATELFTESLAIWRRLGDRLGMAGALLLLGRIAWTQGDYARSGELNVERLAHERALGNNRGIARALLYCGLAAWACGDYRQACRYLHEGLLVWSDIGDHSRILTCLESIASIAGELGQVRPAARLFGYISTQDPTTYEPHTLVEDPHYLHSLNMTRATLGEDALAHATAEGRAMSLELAISYALETSAL